MRETEETRSAIGTEFPADPDGRDNAMVLKRPKLERQARIKATEKYIVFDILISTINRIPGFCR